MKKFFYGSLLLFVILITAVVVAGNSSSVIKKAADTFAPGYHITYEDISGNIFTGVRIKGIKYADRPLVREIRFLWNPSGILYKRLSINEVSAEEVDIDTLRALVASFRKNGEQASASPFPFAVTAGRVHVTLNPFVEQGIRIEKTLLDAEDLLYSADKVEAGDLKLQLDTNVTKLKLHAGLKEGKVTLKRLTLDETDPEILQKMFLLQEGRTAAKAPSETRLKTTREHSNPLIPKEADVHYFSAALKPGRYSAATIENLKITVEGLSADIVKLLKKREGAFSIDRYALELKSDAGRIDIEGSLKSDTATLNRVNMSRLDTLVLKALFLPKSNESSTDSKPEAAVEEERAKEGNRTKPQKMNPFIPKKILLKSLHADIMPVTFEPVHILAFALDAGKVKFDVENLLVEEGMINLKGKTNLTSFTESGKIENNHIEGHLVLTPNQRLFDLYKIPLRKKAVGNIDIDFAASKEKVTVNLKAKAKNIMLAKGDANQSREFNIDIDSLKSRAVYRFKERRLNADTQMRISTPYIKDILVTNRFVMDEKISYEGEVKAGEFAGLDSRLLKEVANLHIDYSGDLQTLKAHIDTEGLKGSFNVEDFRKKGLFRLETKDAIALGELVSLPAELNATRVNAVIDIPLNFARLIPLSGKVNIISNVANIDADVHYDKIITLKATATLPKKSLLRDLDENIRWDAVSPLVSSVKIGKRDVTATLKSDKLSAEVQVKTHKKTVEGRMELAGLRTTLNGKIGGDMLIQSEVNSFKTLLETASQFYTVTDMPNVEGKLSLSLSVRKTMEALLEINAPQVLYRSDRKTEHRIDDVKVVLRKKGPKIELSSYRFTYNTMKFFAKKPSVVSFDKEMITIAQLWLNDQLKVTGELNGKTMQGKVLAEAEKFRFSHEMIDLDSRISIESRLDGNLTDIRGKITLLGGDIHYDLAARSYPSDSDIVIVQEMKKKEPNPLMDNLTLQLQIDTQKPLVYREGPVDVKASADLVVHKSVMSDPLVIGSIDLVDGGSYLFQGKKFILEQSHIYLTGDPSKPILDITVKYQSLRHLIRVHITGTPAIPNILFSSVPSLSKEQILSLLLFDSEEAAAANNAGDMMKMMGGAMAKSALNDLGVKLDHLVIGEGNSVEVGKKLNDRTTVIYINGEIPKIEVKYKYSPSIDVVVGASEKSESLDVVYKKDFNTDSDIVIQGR
ncbi:translocation/assembly module TamB domain-containing protein [Sulfurovum sp. ST-21]|uniref:Translocation/assembly module TamB domain-containing protein n=1 Tax=Sulfurovum indicum TaxID=2779528 RepID=A0A7M1S5G9_9BACT|nr:translocation/assembly module TamB domain-containing protein [Sulfurovum indicum]QOR62663.1 translocation/assembly module TamB domain-containing protein [Sulfurovum indicum]